MPEAELWSKGHRRRERYRRQRRLETWLWDNRCLVSTSWLRRRIQTVSRWVDDHPDSASTEIYHAHRIVSRSWADARVVHDRVVQQCQQEHFRDTCLLGWRLLNSGEILDEHPFDA